MKHKKTKPDSKWRELLDEAIADLAWWYGWSGQVIDDLTLDDFDVWLTQLSRQVKAGYGKGGS